MLQNIEQGVLPEEFQARELSLSVCLTSELPDNYVQQLVNKSRQPHISAFEGREDVGTESLPGRFRSIEAYRTWAEGKQRILYMMLDEGLDPGGLGVPDIGGVIWFGERINPYAPGRSLTFAIRNYAANAVRGWEQYRQCGLGSSFMQATHQDLQKRYQDEKIWLDLAEGNQPAYKLYSRNGYEELARVVDEEHSPERRIVMANDTALMTSSPEPKPLRFPRLVALEQSMQPGY
ncbi:MAG TPA: hypothetical protein VNG32_05030 [Candidatus Dormibacteraeota bacterium]|nr:hypothetical protein [Candidatus Dormibacteraeota bacterium]